MSEQEKEPTRKELEEAAALARALDQGRVGDAPPPEDALAVAALVRGGVLEPRRRQAVLERVLAAARARSQRRVWLWLAPASALAAAAVVVLGLQAQRALRPPPLSLPRPGAALIEAQLEAVRGQPARLETQMRSYRRELLGALASRYGGMP